MAEATETARSTAPTASPLGRTLARWSPRVQFQLNPHAPPSASNTAASQRPFARHDRGGCQPDSLRRPGVGGCRGIADRERRRRPRRPKAQANPLRPLQPSSQNLTVIILCSKGNFGLARRRFALGPGQRCSGERHGRDTAKCFGSGEGRPRDWRREGAGCCDCESPGRRGCPSLRRRPQFTKCGPRRRREGHRAAR